MLPEWAPMAPCDSCEKPKPWLRPSDGRRRGQCLDVFDQFKPAGFEPCDLFFAAGGFVRRDALSSLAVVAFVIGRACLGDKAAANAATTELIRQAIDDSAWQIAEARCFIGEARYRGLVKRVGLSAALKG